MKNRENREKQCDMHTLGPKSLSMLRAEMQENDPNHREPSLADLYIESRKRKLGRTYLTKNEETLENIEKMKALKSCEDGNNQNDPYFDVITKKEHSGRLRMHGSCVTKSTLNKKEDPKTQYRIPSMFLDSIKQQMEKTIAEQVDVKLSYILSMIREANQGKDVHIPDFPTREEASSSSHVDSVREHVDEFDGTRIT